MHSSYQYDTIFMRHVVGISPGDFAYNIQKLRALNFRLRFFHLLPKNQKRPSIETLEKIQFSAVRTALAYRTSTSLNILLAEPELPFIQDLFKFLRKCFRSKVVSNNSSNTYETIQKMFSNNYRKKFLNDKKPSLLK